MSSQEKAEETLDMHNETPENENVTSITEVEEVKYLQPDPEILVPETFVLVNFVGGRRNSVQYKYVCKIQSQFSETEYTVVGFISIDEDKTIFKLVPKDISTVPLSDICAMLPAPVNVDDTGVISFGKKVEVREYLRQVLSVR
ncbi:hypothetical protein ILUMI_16076 [Ignelater luminosus]|uniref:Uncharacterized protein n=1 Tax=Ignelater luminosus TaxID=2038154 RepID=A0A8K0G9A6_IGNLU|nr:hypothetical protein ILUMI_16076 [Ignelater luminosus]